MVVEITNLTDGPGKSPRELRIFNTGLMPGKSLRIQAQYVDSKMRALEDAGLISIGPVPAWYSDYKSRRVLSADEVVAARKKAADVAKAKADAKKKYLGGSSKDMKDTAKKAVKSFDEQMKSVDFSDGVKTEDEVQTESKSGKRKRR